MRQACQTDFAICSAQTVTSLKVNPGEMVLPGQVAAALADLSHLRVETTDLSERDATRVAVSPSVSVFVDALVQ